MAFKWLFQEFFGYAIITWRWSVLYNIVWCIQEIRRMLFCCTSPPWKNCPLKYTFSVVRFTFYSHSLNNTEASFTFKLNLLASISHSFLRSFNFPFRSLIVIYFGANISRMMHKKLHTPNGNHGPGSKYCWFRYLVAGSQQKREKKNISKWHRLFFLRWKSCLFFFTQQMSGKHLMFDDK